MLDLTRLHCPQYDKKEAKILRTSNNENFVSVRSYRSKNVINLPKKISADLAYLIGVILGDGYIGPPLKRKRGGYYCCIRITCKIEYAKILSKIIYDVFGYQPKLVFYRKKPQVCDVAINSIAIYRFITRVISIPYGAKAGKMPLVRAVCESQELYRNFLAGLIDTDGYVCKTYAALVQKDRKFLEDVKLYSKQLLDINFVGPTSNRRIDGKVVGWWIRINKSRLNEFIGSIPLRYKMPP